MSELPTIIPPGINEVIGWLMQHGIQPAGAPFIRYRVINMPGMLDVEVGWPVAAAASGNGRVAAGALPAGRYASVIYTGNYPGLIDATATLLKWGAEQGLVWDSWKTEDGDVFGARLESYWTNPADEPDLDKHETEIAIRLADG
jgi:effector-binding domain-containing protein